jgi:ribonuclease P protein component
MIRNEEDLPAEEEAAGPQAWLSPAHVERTRPACHRRTSPQGSHAADRRIGNARPNVGKLLTLRRQATIDEVFQTGRRLRGKLMMAVVVWWPDRDPGVLFIVGRKVGTAVVRNRVRRRAREAYRGLLPRLRSGCTIAIVAHPPAAQATYRELRDELVRMLTRAGALCECGSE